MRIVHAWLAELVQVPADVETTAREIALRGFEVASVETRPHAVIDFEITANRPDCLNHIGMAREASAIWGAPLQIPDLAMPSPGPAAPLDVRIDDPELCPRYCAQVFEVRIAPSPEWLVQRLDAAGVRSINNIVDVTNYVMLELGQPMHAFDLARLADGLIVVRRATKGERLRTLDGVERTLDPDMLVIADAQRASALGGVMGGGYFLPEQATDTGGPQIQPRRASGNRIAIDERAARLPGAELVEERRGPGDTDRRRVDVGATLEPSRGFGLQTEPLAGPSHRRGQEIRALERDHRRL